MQRIKRCGHKIRRNKMNTIFTVNVKKTGQNIMDLRKKAGLSVKDLQEELGFNSPQAIYKWQQGATLPTIDNLVILAGVLGVKLDDIIESGSVL